MEVSFDKSWNMVMESSELIYQIANHQDWEHVIALSEKRHEQLVVPFKLFPITTDNKLFYRNLIDKMMQSEKNLHFIIDKARNELLKASQQLNNNRCALVAYQASGI